MIGLNLEGLSSLDTALLKAFPIVAMPLHGECVPMSASGKRLVLTGDGVYLEAKSTSLHVFVKIADAMIPHLGPARPFIHLPHGKVPSTHLLAFAEMAAKAVPNEVAAAVVFDEGAYRLHVPDVLSANASHVSYRDVNDEVLLLDMHSHGRGEAYFSATDDASDLSRQGPYIAVVVGKCDSTGTTVARLVVPPYLIPIGSRELMEIVEWQ